MSDTYEKPTLTFLGHIDDPATQARLKVLNTPPNCSACKYSFMEPDDMNLTCGHPDSGTFGLHIRKEPLEHCGFKKFEQHPLRNPDGTFERTIFDELESP